MVSSIVSASDIHENWPDMQSAKQDNSHKIIELGGILMSILVHT